MYVPFSRGKAVLVGHCMSGSCTVCLGLSGSGSFGEFEYGKSSSVNASCGKPVEVCHAEVMSGAVRSG